MESLRKNKNWNLITGLLLTLFGSYRLYQHFSGATSLNTLRLVLSFAFVGYGLFGLYQYFQNKDQ
ncbi:hypothetical protein [Olleya sp. R77988]|uniref:hypothetical protein n=1 Tax=Olleya sp. R77988 TaxID=3093875 RepID=UPI0037CB7832